MSSSTNTNFLDEVSEYEDQPEKKRGKGGWWIFLIVLLLIVIGLFLAFWYMFGSVSKVETIDDAFPEESSRPAVVEPAEGEDPAINILLLGSDSRADSSDSLLSDLGSRADTIMVAHIPSDRSGVQIMSIMRDSWVEIPGHGHAKINAAMAYGGVPLMVQTVEGLLDQRIDHVAVIDFNGFRGITEALDGVTVNNPREFIGGESNEFVFPQGEITLAGEEALAFVRERGFADGDYTRVRNQQLFMKSVASEILSRDTLTNPGRLSEVISTVSDHVAVDSGLGAGQMINLGTSMVGMNASDISTFTMPTNGTGTEGGGQSVVYVNWDELETVQQNFANDELADYQPVAR